MTIAPKVSLRLTKEVMNLPEIVAAYTRPSGNAVGLFDRMNDFENMTRVFTRGTYELDETAIRNLWRVEAFVAAAKILRENCAKSGYEEGDIVSGDALVKAEKLVEDIKSVTSA